MAWGRFGMYGQNAARSDVLFRQWNGKDARGSERS